MRNPKKIDVLAGVARENAGNIRISCCVLIISNKYCKLADKNMLRIRLPAIAT